MQPCVKFVINTPKEVKSSLRLEKLKYSYLRSLSKGYKGEQNNNEYVQT